MNAKESIQTARVRPCKGLSGALLPPSSKYHTLRYILAAFLAEGESVVNYPALSDDTDVLLRACRELGARVEEQEQPDGRQRRECGQDERRCEGDGKSEHASASFNGPVLRQRRGEAGAGRSDPPPIRTAPQG